MPFIPHTESDTAAMLDALEVSSVETLFDEVPNVIPQADISDIPAPLSEQAIARLMREREPDHRGRLNFIGAGAYEHHSPAAVWDIISRGEFYTAYTPYQAEASQGSLQVIFEYQQMMTRLMQMEVSNASLYDGASALAEAALMAVRIKRGKQTRVLYPKNLHPAYQAVLKTILPHQGISLVEVNISPNGCVDIEDLEVNLKQAAAVIVSQPNFFGVLDNVNSLTNLAHQHSTLVIAHVNPLACSLITPPGEWGEAGADIACGEGQPLGIPLASGGPYFGFMTTRKSFVRQMPGRIVAKTVDAENRPGYTLTLQAREQHIRRAKATSNICTNQGLMVVAASVYLQLMGGQGLQQNAAICHQRLCQFQQGLEALPHVEPKFSGPHFHEIVIELTSHKTKDVLNALRRYGIQGGLDLTITHPQLGECLLICTTETKTPEDIDRYLEALQCILSNTETSR